MMSNGKTFDVTEVGIFTPKAIGRDYLATGDVGYIAASIKTVADTRVGDTVTLAENPASEPLAGYKQMNPMVFAGIYPIDSNKYNDLREALENSNSTMPAYSLSQKHRRHSDLVSVVDSWASCTWMLSKNGLSVSLTLTSS